MRQELVAGIILGVIGLSLVVVPTAKWWAATENVKRKTAASLLKAMRCS